MRVLGTGLGPCQEQHVFLTVKCPSNQGWLSKKRMVLVLTVPLPPKLSTDVMSGAGQPPCKHESGSLKEGSRKYEGHLLSHCEAAQSTLPAAPRVLTIRGKSTIGSSYIFFLIYRQRKKSILSIYYLQFLRE